MRSLELLSDLKAGANLSDAQLAKLLETSLVSVSQWQRGTSSPSPTEAQRISELHNRLVLGQLPARRVANSFRSRAIRTRAHGQGILGEQLPEVKLRQAPMEPILERLCNGVVFDPAGDEALKRVIEAHSAECPTKSIPFEGAVSAGKNTYTYDAHTYHTKVPPQGISELLAHYLDGPGLVLDPFGGSGMTGVAALVTGHDCILNELSPAACFIANRFTSMVNPTEFETSVDVIMAELRPLRAMLYSTECRECGKETELLYTVWSYKVVCGSCNSEFLLWDHCKKFGKTVREHKILGEFPCPSCGKLLRKSTLQRTTVEPVLVGYKCCGSKQQEKTHPPSESDRRRIADIEGAAPLADGFYPSAELPNGVNLRQPAKHGLNTVAKFYTRRNLSALSHIWKAIHQVEQADLSGQLAFVFTSLYQRVTKLSEFRFWGGSGNAARFNVPFIFNEANVFLTFKRKARTILDHLEATATNYRGKVVVLNGSATALERIPDNSIDLIFTDPPFGANINYSEMNFIWESWLGRFTEPEKEAIVNRVQGKDIGDYEKLMTESLAECHRVLRPGHWMLLVFMNSSSAVWAALRRAINTSGFSVEKIDAFDKQHATFKQFVSDNTAGMDLVLHCTKPAVSTSRRRPCDDPEAGVIHFLKSRGGPLPTSVFLHVGRPNEIDYRRLYSEWLARCFGNDQEFINFSQFRQIVQEWIEKGPS